MAFVCFPLLRLTMPSRGELESEQTLYQARISEIEKDLELGRLDGVSAEAARVEEARRLIKASEAGDAETAASTNKVLIIVAAIFLPLFSIPIYYNIGTPNVTSAKEVADETTSQASIDDLLEVAERRLSKNPDDVNGWKAVVPVYLRLRRFDDAQKAYQNILRVEGRSPELILKLADAYIEEKQGQVDDRAKRLISEVLSIDKDNAIATFYTGIIALQSDNEDETMRIWQGMVDEAQGNEEWLPVIKGRIAELKKLEQKPIVPPLDQDILNAAQDLAPEERTAMIVQMVSNLAEKLKNKPDDKQGWERLIRSYITLEKEDDARAAFVKASEQFKDDQTFISFLEDILSRGNISIETGKQ